MCGPCRFMVFEQALKIIKVAISEDDIPSVDSDSVELLEAVIDAAWLTDLSIAEAKSCEFVKLAAFLKNLARSNPKAQGLMLTRLEPRLLEACGLIDSATTLNRRQIRCNTSMFYKQSKYNVMMEESQGWARLFTGLAQKGQKSNLLQLIGTFSLDPNKVVDCMIDVAISACSIGESFVHLIEWMQELRLSGERVCEIIAIKLTIDAGQGVSNDEGMWTVICAMIEKGVISLSDILGYLDPTPYVTSFAFKEAMNRLPQGSDPFGFHDAGTTLLSLIKPSVDHRVLLFSCLLKTRQLAEAAKMLKMFGPQLYFDHPPCWFYIAEIVYELLDTTDCKSRLLLFWLDKLVPFSFVSARLVFKLVDLLELEQIVQFVFPALPLLHPMPAISFKLFDRICQLSYQSRFQYLRKLSSAASTTPQVIKMHSQDVKRVMRRVSKENVKQIGRLLGKLSCVCPFTVCGILIDQIKAYDNMIGPLVDALRYSSPILMDCLVMCLVDQLAADSRSRIKDDGVNVAGWLQRVSLFLAGLAKKYSALDLSPIIDFLRTRLLLGQGDELCCLTELIKKMAGVEVMTNAVNETVLELSFGGPHLQHSSTITDGHVDDQKSLDRICKVLLQQDPDCLLWQALARQPSLEVYRKEYVEEEVKAQSHSFDVAFEAFAVFNALLLKLNCIELVSRLPELSDLLDFGIEPHMAWSMLRVKNQILDIEVPLSFNSMQIQNVHVPQARYEQEIAKFKAIACAAQTSPKDKEKALNMVLQLEQELKQSIDQLKLTKFTEQESAGTIIKRAMMSPQDAACSAYYLVQTQWIDSNGVDPFLLALDKLLAALSEREAICYGRFLKIIMLNCNISTAQHCHLFSLFNSAFNSCEFIQVRNSILLLTKLDGCFPIHKQVAAALEQRVRLLHEHDEREDIRVLSTRCQALLATSKHNLLSNFEVSTDGADLNGDSDGEVGKLAQVLAEITSLAASSATSSVSNAASPIAVLFEEGEHVEPTKPDQVVVDNNNNTKSSSRKRLLSDHNDQALRKRQVVETRDHRDLDRREYNWERDRRARERDRRDSSSHYQNHSDRNVHRSRR